MAKIDLMLNPDFVAYQKDLQARLENHVRMLHNFAMMECKDSITLEENLFTIHALNAVIAENESILRLPELYVSKEKRESIKTKSMQIILSIWRKVFIHEQ